MNLFKISWKYLLFKPLSTGLNVLLLALGLAIITVLLLVQDQLEHTINRDAAGIDLVVGAKGSPLQLILSGVYHVDFPTGNIPMKEAKGLLRNRLVKSAIPMALGDNYQGFRIIGTNHDYLALYETKIATGKAWEYPFEVVLGSSVAKESGLQTGDEFEGSHGISVGSHAHDANKFKVVGVLEQSGSVVDRLVLTSIESVWLTHEEVEEDVENHDTVHQMMEDPVVKNGFPEGNDTKEITTVLLQYRSPMAAIQLPRMINSRTTMQAASPSFEMVRLFELLGVGIGLLKGIAIILIFISGLGIFIALYNSLKERKYDLAILRALGATRLQLMVLIFLEGVSITFLGAILGLVLGHSFLWMLVENTDQAMTASISPWIFLQEELWVILYALVVGILASVIPAFTAYQTSIAKQLTKS